VSIWGSAASPGQCQARADDAAADDADRQFFSCEAPYGDGWRMAVSP
jgi:hypothetical protein